METLTDFSSRLVAPDTGSSSTLRREDLRYRFAQLLTVEDFQQALDEAQDAYEKGQVLEIDFRFVREVVNAAQRMGRFRSRPADSLMMPDTHMGVLRQVG